MEAKEKNFGELMRGEKKFKIPFFQRAYVWTENEWNKLFDDMITSSENYKEHFLGSVILKRSSGDENFISIIDGQQRLTTFSILLKVLWDMLDNEGYKGQFTKILFCDDVPKIKHSHINEESYKKLFSDNVNELIDKAKELINNKNNKNNKNSEQDKILSCYIYYYIKCEEYFNKFDNKNDKYKRFMDFLEEQKMWVSVKLTKDEDEQMIFDSINSTGQRLTAADIIKNALFDKIIKKCGENKAKNMYEKYWKKIFEEDDILFWNQEMVTGRIKRTKSEMFLHAFALINGFFDPDKNTLEQLSTKYKKDKIARLDKDNVEEFLESLREYANIYRELPTISKETSFKYNEYKIRLFHMLNVLNISTVTPLLMWLEKENRDLEKIYKLLEIFIISNWMCSINTKDYNKFFADIFKNFAKNNKHDLLKYIKEKLIKWQNKELNNKPTKEKIKEKLMRMSKNKNKYAVFILFWIELFKRCDEKYDTNKLDYVYTLEHLMPQTWQTNWKHIAENEEAAEELIYQIGNMTLLKDKLNSSISNGKWEAKLREIKNYTSLKINEELLDKKEWNAETINERTNSFIDYFFKIWNLDELKNDEQDKHLPKKN